MNILMLQSMTDQTYELPQQWLPVVSFFIPLLVGAATHPSAPARYRQGLAALAAVLVAALEQVIAGFTVEGLLIAAVMAFLVQLASYLGLNQIVNPNRILPNRGIGRAD